MSPLRHLFGRLGAALVVGTLLLSACGYKGDLYHPKPAEPDPELVTPPSVDAEPAEASPLPAD